jgi:hypothetical protein
MVLGGLWLCLWQTRWRALGLVIVGVGLAVAPMGTKPDVLVEREGKVAALRAEDGSLALPLATLANYSVDNWLLADGDDRDATAAAANASFRCDPLGCIGKVKGKTVALVRQPAALEEDCRQADIVIAPFTVGKGCRAARVVVDRKMLLEQAHTRSIFRGSRSEPKPWRRRGGNGLGFWSIPPRSHCRIRLLATPMRMEIGTMRMRTQPAPATMAIRRSEESRMRRQYRRSKPTRRPWTRTRSGPKMRVS